MRAQNILGVVLALFATFTGVGRARAATDEDACWSYIDAQDYQRAAAAGKRATALSASLDAHVCLGRAYYYLGELEPALEEFQTVDRLATTPKDLAVAANWLGSVYTGIGDLENAELCHSRALALARQLKNQRNEAVELNNLASIYSSRGLYDKSLKYYRESLGLHEKEEDKAVTYSNIGTVYCNSGRCREALPWFDKAIAIGERTGEYRRAVPWRLNLGDAYRQLGDFARAETTLGDGLAAALKVGDQYWETVAYGYQGALRRAQQRLPEAADLYGKAAALATRIGAKELAQTNRSLKNRMLHAEFARTFAGIEIGAKGVKALAVDLKEPLEGGFTYTPRFRKTENTNLLTGVTAGAARPAAVEATARAVAGFVDQLQRSGVPGKEIYVLGSSAAGRLTNRNVVAERVKQLAGVNLEFVSAREEAVGDFLGAVPADMFDTGVAIDIGSGNTKISYSYRDAGHVKYATIDVPLGTVTLTQGVQANRKPGESFAQALDRLLAANVRPEVARRLKEYPVLAKRNDFYWVGGAVWASVSLTNVKDDSTALVPFHVEDVQKLGQRLRKDAELALTPSLESIADAGQKERANQQLTAVRSTFSADNVLAGAKLLELLATELRAQKKHLYFSRYGSWLLGYLYAKS